MALIFRDPNTAGPFTTFQDKDLKCRVFRLQAANFTTAGVNTLVGALPADASILQIVRWTAVILDNGATSPTVSIGTAAGGTQFASAVAVTNTLGSYSSLTPVTAIMQEYNIPYTTDIPIWIRGTCATANPNNGDIRIAIFYVR